MLEQADLSDPSLFHMTTVPSFVLQSFTGTAHHVKELLDLEMQMAKSIDQPLFYFGFSHAVNHAMCTSDKSRRKGRDAVRAVPENRLLVESDVHHPQDVLGGTLGAIAYVASARQRSIQQIAETTTRNALTFLRGGVKGAEKVAIIPMK
jgi:Tat protein secretion system quality control protein TatD with DNase activity